MSSAIQPSLRLGRVRENMLRVFARTFRPELEIGAIAVDKPAEVFQRDHVCLPLIFPPMPAGRARTPCRAQEAAQSPWPTIPKYARPRRQTALHHTPVSSPPSAVPAYRAVP